ncbi:MAG: hypothetical protein B7Z02_00435 [Rhodobacterales bacterium 32-67-9]|nr:MAG: hypothetical protein B7Z02_00435 [Rhodobacterales bacterium 32-67-9]
MLILLVIWGHLIEVATFSDRIASAVYAGIYLFHIPAFAMISGMVARPAPAGTTLDRIARSLLFPLVIYQLAYWPFLAKLAPERVGGLLTPHWILWFLASLAAWRAMFPLFARLQPAVSIPLAIIIALAAGYVDGVDRTLSLSRTLVFFPAFLSGYWIAKSVPGIGTRTFVWAAGPLLLLAGMASFAGYAGWDLSLLYGSSPYAAFAQGQVPAALIRVATITSGGLAAVLFILLAPVGPGLLTRLGRATLPIYLMHGFVVVIFWKLTSVEDFASTPAFLAFCGCIAVISGIGLLFAVEAWRSVRRRTLNASGSAGRA